jgi:hypothetical protein
MTAEQGVTRAAQQAVSPPSMEAWDAPLPPRPGFAAPATPDHAMTPDRHAAILREAARTGSWEAAEVATRTMAGQALLAAARRLLRRLWRP